MNVSVGEFMDRIISLYDINKSADIIENYTLKAIKSFIDKKDSEDNLVQFLGSLCFIYSKKDIDVCRVKKFIKNLSNFLPYSNIKLINHISNFMETVLLYRRELIKFYLDTIYRLNNLMEKDHSAMLYRACALPSYKNYVDTKKLENKMIYAWRYNYQMASFNYCYRKYFEALQYINRAIEYCPESLRENYEEFKRNICYDIRKNGKLVD